MKGATDYGSETFTDQDPAYDEKQICDPSFPSPLEYLHKCSICLGFDDIFLADDWARICPKYILSCKNPVGGKVKKEYPTPCFNVGDDDNDDINMIVGGNTDFSFKLLSTNSLTKDIVTDLFVSPFSITNALVMAMMAANGQTLKQILNAFELTKADYNIYDSYDTLIQALQHKKTNLINIIDNELWINNIWYKIISPKFLRDFDRFGDIQSCNFKNQSYVETMKIDNYVEKVTDNLIKQPLKSKNLTSNTVFLFTNTMYFKSNWQYPFIENISETFTDDDKNEKITIKMMKTDKININKYNDSNVEVIELPFDDDYSDISFIMIRPTQEKYLVDGPSSTIEFEKSLNRILLNKWLNGLTETIYTQEIILPFLEMYNCQDITNSLRNLGIINVFDPKTADLTNLTVPHYQVYETNLNRQDYIKITNNDIQIASFVTDGDINGDETSQGKIQHADLPFLFLIMDRSVNLILYAGRVTNPKGWIIYKPNNNNNDKNSHIGTVILSLFSVFIISYCIIKYAYNRTVMQLKGVAAIPHIQQFKACRQFCAEKMENIKQMRLNAPSSPVLSPAERYKQLMNDDSMQL